MLEREATTRAVGDLLGRTRQGDGGALFIVGEPGLGKTTVLDFARRLAAGARVGVARGDAMETGLPFGLIAEALDELGCEDLFEGASPVATPYDARTSTFYRTLRCLQGLAADEPVLLAFDDLHWSDADSLALVSYLCRRIDSMPVAVIATLRPWPPAAEDVCLRLAASGHARVERLDALSREAARILIVDRIGHPVDDDLVEQAWTSTAGNPLLLDQVALAIQRDGDDRDSVLAPHPSLPNLLLHRFGGLSDSDLELARAASVLGSRFRPELAVTLARLPEDEAEQALDALARSGFLRHAEVGMVQFTHLLFQQALYDNLPPLRREELHARAFALLVERGLETEASEHAVRGNVVGNSEAIAILARTGRAALRAGAIATALERLEAAERLTGTEVNHQVLFLLGEARLAKGEGALAAGAFERLLGEPALPRVVRVEALRMLGRAHYMTGDGATGARRFREAAEMAENDLRAAAVQVLLDHSRAAWLTAGPVAALPVVERAREVAGGLDEAARMDVEAARGFIAFACGDPTGLDAAIAAGRWAAADDRAVARDLSWGWSRVRNGGRAAKYAERFADAEAVFATTFREAEKAGSPHAIVSLAAHHADTLARRGRLDPALELAARATALAELAPMAEAFAYSVKALVLLHLDRFDEAARCLDLAERAATVRGQWLPLLRVWNLRALQCFHDGRFDQACKLYLRLAEKTQKLGIGEPCLVPWARHAVAAHIRQGDTAEAERVASWVARCSQSLPCRWPRIAAAAACAGLAENRGDSDLAEAEMRRALALHAEVDLPLERVETLLEFGSFLRRAGRLREAREALREALVLAESARARWLARSVHAELNVAGGRRRRRVASPDELTAQEQRVAELAAVGRSSAEIARQLSLSVRTIETHLGRVYAKLGIHSQRELMAGGYRRPDSHP